jgi:hypothetical protein
MLRLQSSERKELPRRARLSLRKLLTAEVGEQWYLSQANFVYPCLVLLPSPAIFLIAILLYSALGVALAWNRHEWRLNSVLLNLYPFLFHVCFMVFYWCPTPKILVVTEILCLAIFLAGSVHHCLTLVVEGVVTLVKLVRQFCLSSRVAPDADAKSRRMKVEKGGKRWVGDESTKKSD